MTTVVGTKVGQASANLKKSNIFSHCTIKIKTKNSYWLHSNIVFFRHRYLSKCRQRDVTTRYFMCRKCFIYGKYQPEMWSKEKELLTRVISLHHHSTIIQRKRQKNTIFFTGSSRSEMQCSHSLGLYLLFVAHEIQYPLWCVLLYFDELGTAH